MGAGRVLAGLMLLAVAATAMPIEMIQYNSLDGMGGYDEGERPNFTEMMNGKHKGFDGGMQGDLGEDVSEEEADKQGVTKEMQDSTGRMIANAYDRINRVDHAKAEQGAKWADHWKNKRMEAELFHDPMFRLQLEHYLGQVDNEDTSDDSISSKFEQKFNN